MDYIDIDKWPRREIYNLFSGMMNPFYTVSFNLDVTNVYKYAKANGLSFYSCLVYLCAKAINSVDEFHIMMKDGRLCFIGDRQPGMTVLDRELEIFRYVTAPADGTIEEFCKAIEEREKVQKVLFGKGSIDPETMIHITCLPWIDMTAMTNPRDYSEEARRSSIPKLCWGKYKTDPEGRKTMVMTIEVNHRFVDGLHVGRFCEKLNELIRDLC